MFVNRKECVFILVNRVEECTFMFVNRKEWTCQQECSFMFVNIEECIFMLVKRTVYIHICQHTERICSCCQQDIVHSSLSKEKKEKKEYIHACQQSVFIFVNRLECTLMFVSRVHVHGFQLKRVYIHAFLKNRVYVHVC